MIPSSVEAVCIQGRYRSQDKVVFDGTNPAPKVVAEMRKEGLTARAEDQSRISSWRNALIGRNLGNYFESGAFGLCARNRNSEVFCWGGAGLDGGASYAKTQITGLPNGKILDLNILENVVFAQLENGDLWSWGDGMTFGHGRSIGQPSPSLGYNPPAKINPWPSSRKVIQTSGDHGSSCALLDNHELWCWGENSGAQNAPPFGSNIGMVGDGTNINRETPVGPVATDAVYTISSYLSACYISTAKTVLCTGSNNGGLLGDGTTVNRNTYGLVSGLNSITKIQSAAASWCALNEAGEVYCWGHNYSGSTGVGQLTGLTTTAQKVTLSSRAVDLHGGELLYCALLEDKRVSCWGKGSLGTLGDGNMSNNASPVLASGLNQVKKIDMGWNHVCALREDQTVWCWGQDNAVINYAVPTKISGSLKVDDIYLLSSDTCLFVGPSMHCIGKHSGNNINNVLLSY